MENLAEALLEYEDAKTLKGRQLQVKLRCYGAFFQLYSVWLK